MAKKIFFFKKGVDFAELIQYNSQATAKKQEERIFIKISDMQDKRISSVMRLATLNPGRTPVIFYDQSTGKYQAMKNLTLSSNEKTMEKLVSLFGEANVKK